MKNHCLCIIPRGIISVHLFQASCTSILWSPTLHVGCWCGWKYSPAWDYSAQITFNALLRCLLLDCVKGELLGATVMVLQYIPLMPCSVVPTHPFTVPNTFERSRLKTDVSIDITYVWKKTDMCSFCQWMEWIATMCCPFRTNCCKKLKEKEKTTFFWCTKSQSLQSSLGILECHEVFSHR